MPEIIHYVVKQERQVEVTANTLEDAIRLASAAFEHGQFASEPTIINDKTPAGVWGNTTSRVQETKLWAERT